MQSVKGIYENGQVRLLEAVHSSVTKRVIITFLDEDDLEQQLRDVSMTNPNAFWDDYLADKNEDLYQDFLKKKQ